MSGPIGVGEEGRAEVLVEDPVDPVAEPNHQLHRLESTPKERALNGRHLSSS